MVVGHLTKRSHAPRRDASHGRPPCQRKEYRNMKNFELSEGKGKKKGFRVFSWELWIRVFKCISYARPIFRDQKKSLLFCFFFILPKVVALSAGHYSAEALQARGTEESNNNNNNRRAEQYFLPPSELKSVPFPDTTVDTARKQACQPLGDKRLFEVRNKKK